MGRRYVIDHVMSALKIRADRERWEGYLAECLRAIAYNTARQDNVITLRPYHELLEKPVSDEDNEKKAEDIINNIKNKLKGG